MSEGMCMLNADSVKWLGREVDTQKKLLLPEGRKSSKGLLKGLMLKSNLSTRGGRQGGRASQMEGTARAKAWRADSRLRFRITGT